MKLLKIVDCHAIIILIKNKFLGEPLKKIGAYS
jgi:hypothetical protein